MRKSTSRPASVSMLTNASSENRLILPRVKSETLGSLTFSRLAAPAWVNPSFSMNLRSAVIISDRRCKFRDSVREKPRSAKMSPLPSVIFVPGRFRISLTITYNRIYSRTL